MAMGPPKQAVVLTALLLDANRPLSTEVLVERVWGTEAPGHAPRTLHTYVSRIRQLLEPAGGPIRLHRHRSGGYLLELPEESLDLHDFRQLVTQATELDRADPKRVVLLREALTLWRGQPLAGLPGDWATRARTLLIDERIDATVHWADAEIRTGNPAAAIGPLTELAEQHPLVEPLAAALIRTLAAAGRTAKAVNQFLSVRRRLVDELGVEPGAELRAAHRDVVRQTPEPDEIIPAQLPLDVPDFVGRDAEQQRLHDLARTAVIVISGTAGVGKSALVVHWSHRVRRRFPDGQLYLDLLGFDPGGTALSAVDALRSLLISLGVPAARIPAELNARSALYRSVLADRRVLVVLDNAAHERDVRPLLPGAPNCLVVVTSRSQLPGLVAAEGARPMELGLLPSAPARELLSRRLGARRVAAEPAAVDRIIAACARLPLALTVTAARALQQPGQPLSRLAEQLHAVRQSLDAFAGNDEATDVRAVLSWSYRALTPEAARLFRLLGLHPGPDVSLPAVAALLGEPIEVAERQLRVLTRASLLSEHRPDRYLLHDLLRTYAGELMRPEETAGPRARMLDHYVHSAYAADRILYPHREVPELTTEGPVTRPADHAAALAWFAEEHQVLVRLVGYAHDAGLDSGAWLLARGLTTYFDLQGHWQDWVLTQRIALSSATRSGDPAGAAFAHLNLGLAFAQLRPEDSLRHLRLALDGYRCLGQAKGQAHTHNALARILGSQGDPRQALRQTEQAVELFGRVGDQGAQARALNNLGWYHTQLGESDRALACCREALRLHRRIGDRYGEANTLDSLGLTYHHLGDHDRSVQEYRAALEAWREVADRYNEAGTLGRLGDTYRSLGEAGEARKVWERALTMLTDLGHADAEQIRRSLDALH
ncbi:AfsR/SARP family transcriptional regulator [Paractinoplanes atraurantiacus]|uniref:DNA-binding transcriptional activator of the SARP family n=1 Tax=Paractinoplanes atraurantiacus TaxID=1036182 RepID=A0A285GR85_9ACTN|nr:BTAD domain-containing putative transcriptional regulator [Actinoplanes atraurantiacus]SNY25026.1 DNA-binding transcriptional activator of the SARP family [Actinoplanes atraurantiacus]